MIFSLSGRMVDLSQTIERKELPRGSGHHEQIPLLLRGMSGVLLLPVPPSKERRPDLWIVSEM